MNYKNISNLLERYFECNTTAQEEQMLRDYFQGEEVAEELLPYKDLFCGLQDEASVSLPADFDAKIQERIKSQKSRTPFKARIINMNRNLSPMYKAVASVALVITVGVMSGNFWSARDPEPVEYNYANYHDTYSDPEIACEKVADVLRDLSITLKGSDAADTAAVIAEGKMKEE